MGLMASFERGMERFLVPVAIKLNSQKHVAAVRDGFVFTFPIIMASSLIILINFAILSPDGFIAGLLHLNSIFPNFEKAQAIFTPVMNGSVNIMSIMIAFLVARNMAISYEQDDLLCGLTAIGAFFIVYTPYQMIDGQAFLTTKYLGAQGLFVAVIVALITSEIFCRLARNPKITITMPAAVPPAVARSFKVLLPIFFVLLPLANPLTTVALFLGLAGNMNSAERNRQSLMASVYVFAIMMVAYYAGQLVMDTFGISIPGLRIAGGLIVAFIGFRMLFPQQKAIDSPEAKSKSEELEDEPSANIAFVPLAMPSTAGPGTIAMIISSASTVRQSSTFADWVLMVAPPLIFFLVAVILWGSLRSSGAIMRLVGKGGIEAISRLMGFLLVCMGVQFIINGILEIIKTYH
ncbi:PTS system protein, cellobiose-specific IIC component [Shigella boydii ATCC 9905]|nr:PTS system protein, cellobiose-specific IIC component [Shigella boydii ATCC 9905]